MATTPKIITSGRKALKDTSGADTYNIGSDAIKVSISGKMTSGDVINVENIASEYTVSAKGRWITLQSDTQTIKFQLSATAGSVSVRFLDGELEASYKAKIGAFLGEQKLSTKAVDVNDEEMGVNDSSSAAFAVIPTYTITSSGDISEGGTETFTIKTTGLVAGTLLAYKITGTGNAASSTTSSVATVDSDGYAVVSVKTASNTTFGDAGELTFELVNGKADAVIITVDDSSIDPDIALVTAFNTAKTAYDAAALTAAASLTAATTAQAATDEAQTNVSSLATATTYQTAATASAAAAATAVADAAAAASAALALTKAAAATASTEDDVSAASNSATATAGATSAAALKAAAAADVAGATAKVTTFTPLEFALTAGVDGENSFTAFTGGLADDVFTAADATWGAGDVIDGGAGSDTLSVISSTAISGAPGAAKVLNIETVNITITNTDTDVDNAVTLNTKASATNFTGLTKLNVTTIGADQAQTLTAASTTDVVSTGLGAVTVDGGKNISVTTTSGAVTVGETTAAAGTISVTHSSAAGLTISVQGGSDVSVTANDATTEGVINVGTVSQATGAIVVTTNESEVQETGTAAEINVFGGTSQTITANLAGAVNETITGGTITASGSVLTTSVTVNQTATIEAGEDVSGVVSGKVTIVDLNFESETAAGAISTVTLGNYGEGSTVNSGALTTINLSGSGADLTVTNGALLVPTVTSQTLNLTGFTSTGDITLDADVTTLAVSSNTAASTLLNLVGEGVTALTISGSEALTLTAQDFAALTSVTSTNTAGVTLGTALAAGTSFTGGAGDDEISLSTDYEKAISTGAGDDTVNYAGPAATGGSIDAGDGEDTIAMTAEVAATFAATVSNFEVLEISDEIAGATDIDMGNAAGITKLVLNGVAGALTVTNAAANFNYTNRAAVTSDSSIALANSTGTSDTVNVTYTAIDGFEDTAAMTIDSVENFVIETADADTTAQTTQFTVNLSGNAVKNVTLSGDTGVVFTNTGTSIINLDASGLTNTDLAVGGLTWVTGDLAASSVIKGSATATNTVDFSAASTVTYTGGSGDDVITGSNGKNNVVSLGDGENTYDSLAGNQTITGGSGTDTVTVGDGKNTVSLGDGDNAFTAGTGKNKYTGGSGVDTVTVGSGNNTISGGDGDDFVIVGSGLNVLTLGAGNDTVVFTAPGTTGIKYTTITDIATGDMIDLSGVTDNDSAVTPLGDQLSLGDTAGFSDYLAEGASQDASAASIISWFQFLGNTYIVVDDSESTSFVNGSDTVVRLSGLVDLSSSTVDADIITIV